MKTSNICVVAVLLSGPRTADSSLPNPLQIQLWQAPAVTGPWTKVDADAQLPYGDHHGGASTYGPMMSEHLMRNGGQEVYFLGTQWWPVYNVHLWSFSLL